MKMEYFWRKTGFSLVQDAVHHGLWLVTSYGEEMTKWRILISRATNTLQKYDTFLYNFSVQNFRKLYRLQNISVTDRISVKNLKTSNLNRFQMFGKRSISNSWPIVTYSNGSRKPHWNSTLFNISYIWKFRFS